ncbi:hypothetical protein WG947_01780 [Pontibacter sp. H259]|uniref:hypothetical protein n=1 Tax=Pontibacter sp. H259 TaxID=3133421 RepID=UPI0030C1185D
MDKANSFALSESIVSDKKWYDLLNTYLEKADFAEFNILYDSRKLNPELESLEPDLVEELERKNKIYSSRMSRRYRLSDRVKKFILSKPYKDWNNYQFEDLSLIKNGIEIFATITHENYIFAQMSDEERDRLNEQGYDFRELHNINN